VSGALRTKLQAPTRKVRSAAEPQTKLELGVWGFSGAWSLITGFELGKRLSFRYALVPLARDVGVLE